MALTGGPHQRRQAVAVLFVAVDVVLQQDAGDPVVALCRCDVERVLPAAAVGLFPGPRAGGCGSVAGDGGKRDAIPGRTTLLVTRTTAMTILTERCGRAITVMCASNQGTKDLIGI